MKYILVLIDDLLNVSKILVCGASCLVDCKSLKIKCLKIKDIEINVLDYHIRVNSFPVLQLAIRYLQASLPIIYCVILNI